MKTMYKFVLKSYIGPMMMTLVIVMFILMLNFLWRYIDEFVGKGLPLTVIIELMFYATGTMIPLGLPLATLLAAIMTMGNLGENNELLALKAAGVSLPKIMRPIVIVVAFISVGSFFIMNNFVPYSYKKMWSLISDIRQQRQEIEFKDGVFFNGIPNVSIRVAEQDPETKRLNSVLIYDTRDAQNTVTIVADSGYIDLSTDKKFLRLKLYNGQQYEDNRNYLWYESPKLRHHKFTFEEIFVELDGFNFERSGESVFGTEAKAKNLVMLNYDIDSLKREAGERVDKMVDNINKKYILRNDTTEYIMFANDTIAQAKKDQFDYIGYFDTMSIDKKTRIYNDASQRLQDLKFYSSGDHGAVSMTTEALYKAEIEWHNKLSLPISIIIFFLIGAPLGAIIRKGGLGTPMVISVAFFVFYYIMTISGQKMVADGAWPAIYGMWLSSFILFPMAMFLTYKSTHDSQLFNIDAYVIAIKKTKTKLIKLKNYIKNKSNDNQDS